MSDKFYLCFLLWFWGSCFNKKLFFLTWGFVNTFLHSCLPCSTQRSWSMWITSIGSLVFWLLVNSVPTTKDWRNGEEKDCGIYSTSWCSVVLSWDGSVSELKIRASFKAVLSTLFPLSTFDKHLLPLPFRPRNIDSTAVSSPAILHYCLWFLYIVPTLL